MKINDLKINSYGKLRNTDITFKDGINIVYGENEKGKSTLLNCIVSLLYGGAKTKRGKDISDLEKYKPWNGEDYSGKISYTLDNDESYEVFREFGRKDTRIYDKNMDDISKLFSTDKSTGNQFFTEQTGIDESTFTSTVVSFQSNVEVDSQTQNILLQKIANSSSTGDEGISFKKAIDKLNKRQLEEIGSNRSQGKPINVVTEEIRRLKEANEELKLYENYKYDIEDKKRRIEAEIGNLECKRALLNNLSSIKQNESIEKEKLRYNENKIDNSEAEIQKLLDEKERIKNELKNITRIKREKAKITPYIGGILVTIATVIGAYVVTKNILSIAGLLVGVIIFYLLTRKIKKVENYNSKRFREQDELINYNSNIEKRIYEIDAQINMLEKNQQLQIDEAERIKNEVIKRFETQKNSLEEKYNGKIESSSFRYYAGLDGYTEEIEQNNQLLNEKNMELHKLQLDKENIMPKLEELAENEEQLLADNEEYNELLKKNDAINMAKEVIEIAYRKMKSNVAPAFNEKLSANISAITNNKYKRIVINEDDGILVELENGDYKKASLLSKGTIEQLYLAFRLAMIESISSESMPIIFDEIFAYFDDNRLKDTICNLNQNYSKSHQIILFTCTKREEQALRDLNIDYNLINL